MRRRLAVILASDVAGYSRLVAADEESTVARFAKLKRVFGELVTGFHGRIFNTAGDAILAEFDSATEAVRCAIEIQDSVRARNIAFPESQRILFRIGIAIGDVLVQEEDGDLLGDGVNVAARLQTLAQPGGICVSNEVYSHVGRNLSCTVTDLGDQSLKNIPYPVHAFQIDIAGANPALQPPAVAIPVVPAAGLILPTADLRAVPEPSHHVNAKPSGSRTTLAVAGVAAVMLTSAAAGWFLNSGGQNSSSIPVPTPPVVEAPKAPAAPTPVVVATPQAPKPAQPTPLPRPPAVAVPPVPPVVTQIPPAPPPQIQPTPPQAPAIVVPPPPQVAIQIPPAPAQPVADPAGASPVDPRIAPFVEALRPYNMPVRYGRPEKIVSDYLGFADTKIFLVAPDLGFWRTRGSSGPLEANRDRALEGCQITFGAPCLVLAIGENLLASDNPFRQTRQSMPRVTYSGTFNPAMVPVLSQNIREGIDFKDYPTLNRPKAMVIHPSNRMVISFGDTTDDAEKRALEVCQRQGQPADGPCFTYARDNLVVLPLRRTSASGTETAPAGPRPVTQETLIAEFRKFAVSQSALTLERWASSYITAVAPKSLFVAEGRGIWYSPAWNTLRESEEMGAARCQIVHGKACQLLARNMEIVPDDAFGRKPLVEVPNVAYAGPFDRSKIPSVTSVVINRLDIAGYADLRGYKAMALHPYGRLHVGTGTDQTEAEAKALEACNTQRANAATDGPCFTYALGEDVVLPQRRTFAR